MHNEGRTDYTILDLKRINIQIVQSEKRHGVLYLKPERKGSNKIGSFLQRTGVNRLLALLSCFFIRLTLPHQDEIESVPLFRPVVPVCSFLPAILAGRRAVQKWPSIGF